MFHNEPAASVRKTTLSNLVTTEKSRSNRLIAARIGLGEKETLPRRAFAFPPFPSVKDEPVIHLAAPNAGITGSGEHDEAERNPAAGSISHRGNIRIKGIPARMLGRTLYSGREKRRAAPRHRPKAGRRSPDEPRNHESLARQ